MHDHDKTPEPHLDGTAANRREELKQKIQGLGGVVGGILGAPPDLELSFLERVIAWETGPSSTHREWLAKHCLFFSGPDELSGHQLHAELWRLIEALAMARVFLEHTNHLSDAELYAALYNEVLDASAPDVARTTDDACHWDFADGGGSGEQLWLTYHATEAERQEWVREFPDVILPPRERPLHRRDHRLPYRPAARRSANGNSDGAAPQNESGAPMPEA